MPIFLAVAGGAILGALSERNQWRFIPNYKDLQIMVTGDDPDLELRAFERAKQFLISEEGRRNTAYLDTRGFLTVGIGHLVIPADNIKLGQVISEKQIDEFFAKDAAKAFNAAVTQAKELNRYNVDMIARLCSVNFQLGTGWRSKFPNTWTLLKAKKSSEAINNLLQSAWYKQTPNRVLAFAQTIQTQFA